MLLFMFNPLLGNCNLPTPPQCLFLVLLCIFRANTLSTVLNFKANYPGLLFISSHILLKSVLSYTCTCCLSYWCCVIMGNRGNPHEIIPISFDMKAILNDKYYNVGEENRYLVQTWSEIKDTGIKVPEVHGAEKGIDPNLKPEWTVRKSQKLAVKPKLEQDRSDPSVQKQTQVTEDNHVKDQLMPEQRKNVGTPQVEQKYQYKHRTR